MSTTTRTENHRAAARVWRRLAWLLVATALVALAVGGATATLVAMGAALAAVVSFAGARRERRETVRVAREDALL